MNTPLSSPIVLFRICELFFEGKNVAQIAKALSGEMKRTVSRERVYPLLRKALDEGLLRMVPPIEQTLASEVADQFEVDSDSGITVVNTATAFGRHADHVATVTARVAMDRILELQRKKKPGEPVHLGLGPGHGTLMFSRELSKLLQDPHAPKLRLYAITAGVFNDASPEYSPLAFFNVFPPHVVDGCVALFAETVVRCVDFPVVIGQPGVAHAFEQKENVEIVVTSMGDITDPRDQYGQYLEKHAPGKRKQLMDRGCIGNIQYRPYTDAGPLKESPDDLRAVTMFELDELTAMAQRKGRHVILMARRFGTRDEAMPRSAALWPLMRSRKLRVWSDLVTHVDVARELLVIDRERGGLAE
ncbi:MAG: hypothetical protein CMJ18_03225 [Phycisphaeraceae bacterium]|nr:hypothetical protein [Phycisphaeraceae bacterium]